MRRKVEVERYEPIMGNANRPVTQYEVRGSLLMESGEWRTVLLTRHEIPFAYGPMNSSRVAKTEAMILANEWFKMSDSQCEALVFGTTNDKPAQ